MEGRRQPEQGSKKFSSCGDKGWLHRLHRLAHWSPRRVGRNVGLTSESSEMTCRCIGVASPVTTKPTWIGRQLPDVSRMSPSIWVCASLSRVSRAEPRHTLKIESHVASSGRTDLEPDGCFLQSPQHFLALCSRVGILPEELERLEHDRGDPRPVVERERDARCDDRPTRTLSSTERDQSSGVSRRYSTHGPQ